MNENLVVNDQEKKVKKLKRELEGWREVILPLNSVFLWEKSWYAGMLVGIVTTVFLLLWYVDPSVLTTFSLIGLVLTLVDYLVPTVTSSWCNPDSWTGTKERKLEEICQALVHTQIQVKSFWSSFQDMRGTRPRLYYVTVIPSLLLMAWLGNVINNLFLTYLIVVFVVLLPGLKHHGILHKYFAKSVFMIADVLKGTKQKKN